MTSCASPHPIRDAKGSFGAHADLDVMGHNGTDCWARCKKCGRWFWLTSDDSSKWQYYDEWEIDRDLAERALVQGDANAAAQLFVSADLPRGPLWTVTSALVDIFRFVTPKATDAERRQALAAVSPKPGTRWAEAAKLLVDIGKADPSLFTSSPDLHFMLDLSLPGRTFDEGHELGASLVLFQSAPTHALVRIDAAAVTASEAIGPMHFLARNADALVYGITTPNGQQGICHIDSGSLSAFPPTGVRYSVTTLDAGWWLFVPQDNSPVRYVEFHTPDAQPRVKMRMAFPSASTYACPPRKMGDGWIVSGCVDDEGREQALTLFDAGFKMVAQSERAVGQRVISVIDEYALWCETVENPYIVERWERRGDVLERTLAVEAQSWIRVSDGVVISLRKVNEGLVGYDDLGSKRMRLKRPTRGATYLTEARDGLLVSDDGSVETIDPRSGNMLAEPIDAEGAHLLVGRQGTTYLSAGASVWVLGQERTQLLLGQGVSLETTCGDDALIRDDKGQCLVVGPDASVRGRFYAPEARFSVVGTRGGPYLIEPGRVRIGKWGAPS